MRADTSRRIGHFTIAPFLICLLTVSLVVLVKFTFAQSQTVGGKQFPQNIIVYSSTDINPHLLTLKATRQGDAEPERVSGFNLDITNAVAAQINSQLLVFVTDISMQIIEAKVRTVSDQLIDLVPVTSSQAANAFSLTNLPAGVYTLDVITRKGNTKAAYEGILVISQQPTVVINETTKNVINQEINQNMRVDTEEKCPAGYVGKPPFCEPTTPTPTLTPTLTPTPTPVGRAPGKATVEQGAPPGVEEPTIVLTPTPDEGLLPPPPPTTDEQPLPR